jgi:hypothetical protein
MVYVACNIRGQIDFEMITDVIPTPEEIYNLQVQYRYHPAGYGGPSNVKTVQTIEGKWRTSWNCRDSCD